MEDNIIFDRKLAVQKAKEESERSDLKQHADKMLRDFEKFNDFSSNRAIWELVQNACDLTSECEVILDYRDGKFAFTHNGRPFNSNSLVSLIKQVSGDKDEKSETPPVGKYGTGFLTTHSLGRKFIIDSVLLDSSGSYIEITNFLVDRSPKKWEDLSEQIRLQKNKVFEIIETGQIIELTKFVTTFTYLPETDQEKKYITESFKDLEEYIPVVLTINNRLKSVKVISAEGKELYFVLSKKELVPNESEISLYKTSVRKNDDEKIIYSVVDIENEIEIILPINGDLTLFNFPDRIARLFLYYPLVGSENFGVNFIINCTRFLPTEPRDGIHLNSNKDQVKDQETVNKILIHKASLLLFKFLNSNSLPVKNPLLYANINFRRNSDNNILNQYFSGLQDQWIQKFKDLEIVETNNGYRNVAEVVLLDPFLMEKDEYFECIYYLLKKFYTDIPSKETIKEWSLFVSIWSYGKAIFINNEDLIKNIQSCTLVDFDAQLLKKYYEYLINEKKGNLFADYKLLPNLEGKFHYLNNLKRAENINTQLIDIGKRLIEDSIAQLVNEMFVFHFHFDNYKRKDFSNSITAKLNEILTDNHLCYPETFQAEEFFELDTSIFQVFDIDYFKSLLIYCKLNTNLNSQSRPSRLMVLISEYFKLDNQLVYINALDSKEEDIDNRSAQKKVVKLFFNTLLQQNDSWIKNNIDFLYHVVSCYEDRYKDVYLTSKIYPNQLFRLNLLSDLKKDVDLKVEIVKLYDKVTDKIIGDFLAHKKFNEFLINNEEVTNKKLASGIEEAFFETDIQNINEHRFKDDILNIISKLNKPFYKELFTRLDDKKANLMLEIVTNENTKEYIFSIVTLKESQLKKLGQLIQEVNFEEILQKTQDVIKLEKQKRSDFEHKYKIGTYIEKKIREKLSLELVAKIRFDNDKNLNAEDVQGGQDIVIYYENNPIYFIEVKSRWDSRNSILMSKLQLERASANIDKYSLISVDITKYQGNSDRYKLEEEEIMPLVKVVNSIGKSIEPLIANNLIAEQEDLSNVKLIDYKGLINQKLIESGQDFEVFVTKLVNDLNVQVAGLNELS